MNTRWGDALPPDDVERNRLYPAEAFADGAGEDHGPRVLVWIIVAAIGGALGALAFILGVVVGYVVGR